MREDGGPNKEFLTFLFCNNDLAVQFLKDVGLVRRKVQCNKCDRDMTWSPAVVLRILSASPPQGTLTRVTTVTSDRLGWFRLFFF
jgi:hypothetical protein